MASDIFSANPKSFNIHRRSQLASKLKSYISQKLLEFLVNYTDQVLIDYIIVLICNGKDQYQARESLEAFLGDRSTEFVSWLWDFLAKHDYQSYPDFQTEPKDDSLHGRDRIKDRKVSRVSDSEKPDVGDSMTEDLQTYYHSSSDDAHHCGAKLDEGFKHYPDSGVPSSMESSKRVISLGSGTVQEKASVGATKSPGDKSLPHETPKKGVSSMVVASGGKRLRSEIKKIDDGKCNGLQDQLLHIPEKEPAIKNLQQVVSDSPSPEQVNRDNISRRNLSQKSSSVMHGVHEKPRVSVWDRLGKPRESVSIGHNRSDAQDVNIVGEDEVFSSHKLLRPLSNHKVLNNMSAELPRGMSRTGDGSYSVETRNSELSLSPMSHPHAANNIARKRHFGDLNDSPSGVSDFLVNQRSRDHLHHETSQGSKKPKPLSWDSKAASSVVTEVLDVKQRLRQVEMEMSKLKSKQQVMEKDGKPDSSSFTGIAKQQGKDLDSRTVFVTNVHYAASREALSLFFAKCGAVANAVTLTDKATGQPKGSAYVTFSSRDSVEKALALSGTTFFSRTIKVLRKAESSALAASLTQLPGKQSQAPSSYTNKVIPNRPHHLQWRRASS